MGKAYEFYKHNHPDQFSDSEIIRAAKLDKTFLDYYLNTLTSRGEEKKFEVFCRRIAEKEICPNLIPQTGPTAIQERWTFAFSAKQEWKSKLYSDIEKITEVNCQPGRGYTKIYFMSNQFISDRNRAKAEDDLRQKYNMDVRFFC
ncbi:hypothetical protein HNQ56_003169 [Anaerotaenia torta]|uniref:hypothetical protein n=1 Tax=Anaerotaenia torta TaxID=433293 RepID=UPI003D222748